MANSRVPAFLKYTSTNICSMMLHTLKIAEDIFEFALKPSPLAAESNDVQGMLPTFYDVAGGLPKKALRKRSQTRRDFHARSLSILSSGASEVLAS